MPGVRSGGPSTINGIVYQMLWAMQTLGSFRANSTLAPDGSIAEATLVLEPLDGGDQQQYEGGHRIVVQLKSRSDGRTWSLQEVIRDVFPDLYRAVELANRPTEFQFVTDGERGNWAAAETFFASLRGRVSDQDLKAKLNDRDPINFARKTRVITTTGQPSFWESGPYTELRLFNRIVKWLHELHVNEERPIEEVERKLSVLLSGFRFRGGHTMEGLRNAIDRGLLARVGSADDLVRRRDAMLQDLAVRATQGNHLIDSKSFFEHHGLDATPLTDWFKISDASRQVLSNTLERRAFDVAEDVRPSLTESLYSRWTVGRPVMILAGDGGLGKTWLGYSLLQRAASEEAVSLLVEATGDAQDDMATAAGVFWNRIVGHDTAPPFVNIRKRLRQLGQAHAERQLCVLFDGVTDAEEARRLVREPWEQWGVRVILTCHHELTVMLRSTVGEHGLVFVPSDFTAEELQEYLAEVVGPKWPEIPAEIRRLLRRPLLARLYRDLIGRGSVASDS